MSELDVIGTLCGTDKSSAVDWAWDYLRHYEQLFLRFKGEPINLIEIGVLGGSSIETWLRFFERATIVGIDINPDCARFAGERAVIRIGSQDDPAFLQSVAAEYPPSIVIDDGSHFAHHMIATFETLFPALVPGGIYVFEDLAFHYEESQKRWHGAAAHKGESERSIHDYLSPFLRARMADVDTPRGTWGFAKYAFENIDSIAVFGSVLAVQKRAPRPCTADIAAFERMLARDKHGPRASLHYAAYLIRHNVNVERAFDLLKNQLGNAHADLHTLLMLHGAAEKLGRHAVAADAAVRIATLKPFEAQSWHRIAAAYRQLGQPDQELVALRRLVELDPHAADALARITQLCEQAGNLEAALDAARRRRDLASGDQKAAARVHELEQQLVAARGT